MKILVAVTYYTPHLSGLTTHAELVAEGLAQRHHQVTVLCYRHDPSLPLAANLHGVKVIRIPFIARLSKGFLSLRWFIRCWRELRHHDAVILHLPQPEAWYLVLLARLFHKPCLVFYHCDLVLPPSLINRGLTPLINLSHRFTLNLATTILHSTQDYARSSPLLIPHLDQMVFTYPPIKSLSSPSSATPSYFNHQATYHLGFVGRFSADKGLPWLLEALTLLNSKLQPRFAELLLVGPSSPVGETSLILPALSHLTYVPPLANQELNTFYHHLDVLVLPSVNRTESFGTVQVEAMLAGTPVVASDLPGIRIPIQVTKMGLLVPPQNPPALASALHTVLLHHDNYRQSRVPLAATFNLNTVLDTYAAHLS
jgi:glycosyltransferase involved in cell wall biosynthesis